VANPRSNKGKIRKKKSKKRMKVSLMEHRERDDPSRKIETFDGISLNLLLKLNGGS
jgi:hypothetical protein